MELNSLNCTEGKRGPKGLGDFKSIMQEGQFKVETENLNLSWELEIYYLNGKQITEPIGTAEHLVLTIIYHGSFIDAMAKNIRISHCYIIIIHLEPKFANYSFRFL